jgi:hypothetical protein
MIGDVELPRRFASKFLWVASLALAMKELEFVIASASEATQQALSRI